MIIIAMDSIAFMHTKELSKDLLSAMPYSTPTYICMNVYESA